MEIEVEGGAVDGWMGGAEEAEGGAADGKGEMHGAGIGGEHAAGGADDAGALADTEAGGGKVEGGIEGAMGANLLPGLFIADKNSGESVFFEKVPGHGEELFQRPPFEGIGAEAMHDHVAFAFGCLFSPGKNFLPGSEIVGVIEEQFGAQVVDGDAGQFSQPFFVGEEMFRWIGSEKGVGEKVRPFAFAPADPLRGAGPANQGNDVGIVGMEDQDQVEMSASQPGEGGPEFFPFAVVRDEVVEVRIAFEDGHAPDVGEKGDFGIRMALARGPDEGGGHDAVADGCGADEEDAHLSLVAGCGKEGKFTTQPGFAR